MTKPENISRLSKKKVKLRKTSTKNDLIDNLSDEKFLEICEQLGVLGRFTIWTTTNSEKKKCFCCRIDGIEKAVKVNITVGDMGKVITAGFNAFFEPITGYGDSMKKAVENFYNILINRAFSKINFETEASEVYVYHEGKFCPAKKHGK